MFRIVILVFNNQIVEKAIIIFPFFKKSRTFRQRIYIMSRGHLILFLLVFFLYENKVFSQGMGISEASITPDASAILELRSTLRGLLVPRMTNAQRTTLAATAVQGLLVYDTQDNLFYYYNGGWQAIFSGTSPLAVASGGTGVASFGGTNTVLYTTSANTLSSIATANGGVLNTNGTGVPSITATPTLGVAGATLGTLSLSGNTSGTISIRPQAAAGTYNFNLPAGAGSSGQILQSGGGAAAAMTWSTPTYPSASGAVGNFLISDGTNNIYSTSTIPTSAGATAGRILVSNGTNYILSTPTFPNASAAVGRIIISDGTNWISSTPTYPNTSGTTGQILRSDGTNNVYTTLTFPNTISQGEIPYGSAANVISNLATGTAGQILATNGVGADPTWITLGGAASLTANAAATAATTILTGATWTLPANTATAGMVIRLRCNYRFVKTIAPPTLTCNLTVNGASVAAFVISSVSSGTTSGGYIEGFITIRTIGAGGTLMSSLNGANNHGITNATNWNPTSTNIAATAINTTLDRIIALTMRMTTAVLGNTLTISQGVVEVVKP